MRTAAKEGLKSDFTEAAMEWGAKAGKLLRRGATAAMLTPLTLGGKGIGAGAGYLDRKTGGNFKRVKDDWKTKMPKMLGGESEFERDRKATADRLKSGLIDQKEHDADMKMIDNAERAHEEARGKSLSGRAGKFMKAANPMAEFGRNFATDGSIVAGAQKVWESWNGNMNDMKEADALKWGKVFANIGHASPLTVGALKASGFDVKGIKASIQLKLDNEIFKGVKENKGVFYDTATRQQIVARIKDLEGDAANGDRGAQIEMSHALQTLEQKHITFFRAEEKEARDLMEIYEKIIKNHEEGKTNLVTEDFARSTGDRLGTMGAKNPVFSGAIIRDGVGKGFLEDASGNRIWLHEHPDRKTSVNLKKVDLNYLKGSNGPSMLKAIAEGKVDTQHQLSDSILRAILDEEQRSVHQISDDLVEALQKMKGVDRFRGQIEGVEQKVAKEKAAKEAKTSDGGDSGSSGLVDAHGRPIS
ncbi:MAG: hypothetical protein PWQ57_1731 [Desulfovibrionales bacterium]|nr:hypothetical protein [Desulfovibrionales bacterium]